MNLKQKPIFYPTFASSGVGIFNDLCRIDHSFILIMLRDVFSQGKTPETVVLIPTPSLKGFLKPLSSQKSDPKPLAHRFVYDCRSDGLGHIGCPLETPA